MLKILGLWVLASCTLGPLLSWLFFYSERMAKREASQAKAECPAPSSELRNAP